MRAAIFLVTCLVCSAGCVSATVPMSNGAKLGAAAAFAGAAAALQVAESAAEARARSTAPVTHSSVQLAPECDNDGQYACVTASVASPEAPPEPEMSVDDARDYVLGYVNGVRKLNGVDPVVRDPSLDTFAQSGSEELAADHLPREHIAEHAADLHAVTGEIQGPADGLASGALQDRLADVLLRATREGPGGPRHDTMLRRDWRRLGVGIADRDGKTYFTVDFTN